MLQIRIVKDRSFRQPLERVVVKAVEVEARSFLNDEVRRAARAHAKYLCKSEASPPHVESIISCI